MKYEHGWKFRTTPMNHEEMGVYIAKRIRMENGHEIWQLSLDSNGFPKARNARKAVPAHRMVWEHRTGETLTRDMMILNRCGVIGCVTPAHHIKVHGRPASLAKVPEADRVPRQRVKPK